MKIKHKKILVCGLSLAVFVGMLCGCTEADIQQEANLMLNVDTLLLTCIMI